MKIVIGSDHGGYNLKEEIKKFLQTEGCEIFDVGCLSEESCDYSEFGHEIAKEVIRKKISGIAICGTGIGISIAANKIAGARCALCTTSTHARLAREHNDANILALGGRITGTELAKDIVTTFLNTPFSEAKRHKIRIAKIEKN